MRVDTERPGEKAAVMVHKVRKYSHCCTSKSNPILLTDIFFPLDFWPSHSVMFFWLFVFQSLIPLLRKSFRKAHGALNHD